MRKVFTLFFLFFVTLKGFAQTDLPNPPSDFQIIPAGAWVVAMDTAHQKWPAVGQTIFNLKSYGLVNQFLQNQFPVKWAIRAGKSLNGIDFSASAYRVYPTATTAAMLDFRGGPFIIPDTTICGLTTQDIIQNFGNNVCVYRLVNPESIDIRYEITNAPKIAIFTNGGNQNIHSKILVAAGIPNYQYLDAANIGSLSNCFTLVSEPHWDFNDADSIVVNGVKNFVINGGNFFAQCQALETYENLGFFATTSGIDILNKNMLHMYHNADLPILQINGLVTENQGGSVRNWTPKAGSTWKSTTYKVISHLGGDTLVSLGMHLAPPTVAGGNAFILGSHDYYSLTNLKAINALRMYLNAAIMPSPNNHLWARAGMDQTLACSGTISLGCPPTGPPASTYSWTPAAGLSCTTCPNPVANPGSTTNYTVTVTNAMGCSTTDNVLINSTLVYPVAGFSMNGGSGVSACVNASVTFTDHSTNGATSWSWDFGDGYTSNLQNPAHAYAVQGSYTVTLTASNAMGCSSTAQQTVTVNPNPVVDFVFWPACSGHPLCFGNLSTISSGSITGWSWNFGDTVPATNTSTLQSPCHLFSVSNANVSLTATSNAGCQTVLSKPVTLSPDPVAAFNSTNSCETTPTCFTDLSSVSSGSIVSWNWNFIDPISGVTASSTSQNPCNMFTNYSGMTAQLIIVTDSGCSDTITQPVSFRPMPVADFTSNSICEGGLTCFNNLSSISSGTIASYDWHFDEPVSGTGDTSSVLNPCRTYMSGGIYNASLIVTSDLGCQNTAIVPTEVFHLPVPDFTPSFACFGIQNCFTDLSSVASGSITNYNWSFTDMVTGLGDTSTLQSPCYVISTYNPHDITLILTTDHGCGDTLSKTVSVSEVPQASFNSAVVCPGVLTCFSDMSIIATGSITGWNWDFSDPLSGPLDTSNSQNPCHLFITPSPMVTLTVTSDIGCQHTVTQPIGFNPAPVSDFTWTQTCNGASTSFSNISSVWSGTIVSINWDFGEPSSGLANISVLPDPVHTYSSANTFNVTLTTISSNGCQNSLTRAITVDPVPVANFSTTPVCQSNQTCFTNLTSIASGTIVTHDWTFGDPGSGALNISSLQDECHIYNNIGTNTVTLIEISDKGCSDTISSVVTVSPNPVANFNSNIACPGTPTCFNNLSSIPSGSITGWDWSFSDPSSGSDSSSIQMPCHVFQNTSSPLVTLIVTSALGCKDTVSSPESFHSVPVPDYSNVTVCLGQPTCFSNLSSISAGSITNIQWTFDEPSSGIANNSSASNPCHTYSSPGTFDVKLDITTDMGCQDSITKQVDVSPIPTAGFSAPRTCDGNQTCFNDLSTVGTGTIISYDWAFGDPGSGANSSAVQNPCHLYSTLNPYNVKLVVTSDNGCKDSVISSFALSPLPVANFSSNIVCPDSATCFTNLSSILSGTITGFQWNFSDPATGAFNSSSAQNPCHTFINKSNPNVILTLTSDSGCQSTFSTPVSFHPIPVTDFYFFPVCLGSPSCFNNVTTLSSGSIFSNQWTFGEPSSGAADSSNATNACHTYSSAGLYDVTLTVTTDKGCQHSFTKHPDVTPIPTAAFSAARTCEGDQTCFTDLSTVGLGTIISYTWDFDDPGPGVNNSSLQNPCYSYSSLSAHNVKLVVVSDNGCSDSTTSSFALSPLPVANFSSTVECPGNSTCFTDLSSIPSGMIAGYQWNFSDTASGAGDTSSSQNPCHTFIVTNPNVMLTLTSDSGCIQSYTSPVTFHPVPISDFNFNTACLGTQSCFSDLSTVASGTINSLQWTFGEPSSGAADNSIANNPCHTYASSGTFDVKLDVTTDKGCQDYITKQVDVSPIPTAAFGTNTTCEGSSACFNDLSTVGTGTITSYRWDFGDPASGTNNSSPVQNACHLYSTLSTHNVTLVVSSDNGCSDSVTSSFALSPLPVVDFSSTVECPGTTTCFTDLSSIPSGMITGYQWNFSDTASGAADTSTSQNPCHTFIASNPNVMLTLTSDSGCQQTFNAPVAFHPMPVPDFTSPTSCFGSQTCFVNATSVSSGSIIVSQWEFDDVSSGSNYSSTSSACHNFSADGTYNVKLTETSDNGCIATISQQVIISPLPVAAFNSSSVCLGAQSCFNDQSSVPLGNINSWEWDFGDPGSGASNVSALQGPCHMFNSLIPYDVRLIVTTGDGCKDTLNSQINVSPVPVATFSSTTVCPGNATCFNDISTISSGSITGWKWNFSGSTLSDSSAMQNPCYVYNDSSATALLTVTSNMGCQHTVEMPVNFNTVPVPDFSDSSSCFGTPVCLNNQSSIAQGTITGYAWNFGDAGSGAGNSSTTISPCHNFSSANTYNINLSVTSDLGCIGSISRSIVVHQPPSANFTALPVCINAPTEFINQSSFQDNDSIGEWIWNFDDGSNSNMRSPSHLFNQVRTFNVSLITTAQTGCSDTIVIPVIVHAKPQANISSPQEGCASICGNFYDLSLPVEGSITSRQWLFPGGNPYSSTQKNPNVCYTAKGFYPVRLIVTNTFGCADTLNSAQHTKVYPVPEADFYIIKEPDNLLVPELSLGHLWSNDVVKWNWDFGDRSPIDSVNQDPSHSYRTAAMNNGMYNFRVTLNVMNQFRCVSRISREINIKPAFSFYIPNTFTPNGDYPNDVFFGKGRGISEYKIRIFDRWGNLIWQCEEKGDYTEWDKDNGDGLPSACKWDGMYHNTVVQQDTYVWKVDFKNVFGESFNYIGHVNVVK